MIKHDFGKLEASLRGWLLGAQYFDAVKALEWAKTYHTGLRKDGITPEFFHQISIANFARTLEIALLWPEEVFIVIFCHDLIEDYNVSKEQIADKFGDPIADCVELLTNRVGKNKKDKATMYSLIATDEIASIVKGIDRLNNIQTMVGVFTLAKQKEYILEVKEFILPMLKTARKLFPEQEAAYQNIRHILMSQLDLIKSIHEAMECSKVN